MKEFIRLNILSKKLWNRNILQKDIYFTRVIDAWFYLVYLGVSCHWTKCTYEKIYFILNKVPPPPVPVSNNLVETFWISCLNNWWKSKFPTRGFKKNKIQFSDSLSRLQKVFAPHFLGHRSEIIYTNAY